MDNSSTEKFNLGDKDYIELNKLLKIMGWVETGAEANISWLSPQFSGNFFQNGLDLSRESQVHDTIRHRRDLKSNPKSKI